MHQQESFRFLTSSICNFCEKKKKLFLTSSIWVKKNYMIWIYEILSFWNINWLVKTYAFIQYLFNKKKLQESLKVNSCTRWDLSWQIMTGRQYSAVTVTVHICQRSVCSAKSKKVLGKRIQCTWAYGKTNCKINTVHADRMEDQSVIQCTLPHSIQEKSPTKLLIIYNFI